MRFRGGMDLDSLLVRYFGGSDLAAVSPERLEEGRETLTIDFGREQEPGRKFALWVLLEAIGAAPYPADAFPDHPQLRRSADDYLSASERLMSDD